jgi:phosphate transport system substrate-binding protein
MRRFALRLRDVALLLSASLVVSFAGCPAPAGDTGGNSPTGKIEIDGSSTVFKLTQAVAEEFRADNAGVQIKVDKSGTGGGFKNFVLGKLAICNASRPIATNEIEQCKVNGVEYIELPVAFDAITIAVNIRNTWCDAMTVAELKKLWEPEAEGKITRWNQLREGWPDLRIELYGQGHDSGTFEYFTEAIVKQKNKSRTDCTASEDDNVILLGIEGDKGALGYVPYAYFAPRAGKTMKAVKIDSGNGPVPPSPQTVKDASYKPLSRPLFIYINRKAAEEPAVKQFVEFYLANGEKMAEVVGYIPLNGSDYPKVFERFRKLQSGTSFGGGSSEGKTLEDILNSQPEL